MPYLTPAEAARLRGVNRSTITRWLRAGLRHRRIGSVVLINRADLVRFTPRNAGRPPSKR